MVLRKTIQFVIGIILSILGVPSEEGIIQQLATELLCNSQINQCQTAESIALILFLAGIIAVVEVIVEVVILFRN